MLIQFSILLNLQTEITLLLSARDNILRDLKHLANLTTHHAILNEKTFHFWTNMCPYYVYTILNQKWSIESMNATLNKEMCFKSLFSLQMLSTVKTDCGRFFWSGLHT